MSNEFHDVIDDEVEMTAEMEAGLASMGKGDDCEDGEG